MSAIDDKIAAELSNIDIKGLITAKVNTKIDKLLKNKSINHMIDHAIRDRITQEVNNKL